MTASDLDELEALCEAAWPMDRARERLASLLAGFVEDDGLSHDEAVARIRATLVDLGEHKFPAFSPTRH